MTSGETTARDGLGVWQRAGLAFGALALAAPGPAVAAEAEAADPPLNPGLDIINIVVDDMDDFSCADAKKYLPKSSKYLARQGTCFENATADSPVCCPARAVIMTGQLPHNNGVETIEDGMKLNVANTLQYTLRAAGITTYGVGKYLNGVKLPQLGGVGYDTGFSEADLWKPDRYKEYQLVSPTGRVYTPKKPVHTTVRTGRNLRHFTERMLDTGQQYYAYAAFMAPHDQHQTAHNKDMTPEPTAANRHKPVPPFRYNPETDTRDKLPVFQGNTQSREFYEQENTARVRSFFDIDDQVAKLFRILERRGALDNTLVIFSSDNGFELGRNNWEYKGTPYPGSLNIPMMAYLPGTFSRAMDKRPVSLVDIAPTIYSLLGIAPPVVLDGHSLASSYRRQDEYHELTTGKGGDKIEQVGNIPSWTQYATHGKSYIEFTNPRGKRIRSEFYTDPGNERNLLYREFADEAPNRKVLAHFRQQLRQYQTCAGTVETGAVNPCT